MGQSSNKKIITISGMSTSGKSILESRLVKAGLGGKVVSFTTRPMRKGEVDGVDYDFLSHDQVDQLVEKGGIVELIEFNGNCYGGTKAAFERAMEGGKAAIFVCEPNGAREVREYGEKNGWDVVNVFLDTPSETLAKRIVSRAIEDGDELVGNHANRLTAMTGMDRDQSETILKSVVSSMRGEPDQAMLKTRDAVNVLTDCIDSGKGGEALWRDMLDWNILFEEGFSADNEQAVMAHLEEVIKDQPTKKVSRHQSQEASIG